MRKVVVEGGDVIYRGDLDCELDFFFVMEEKLS